MAAEVAVGADFRIGTPKALFQAPLGFVAWDAAADGQRFLFAVPEKPQAPFTVVLNWMAMLKR